MVYNECSEKVAEFTGIPRGVFVRNDCPSVHNNVLGLSEVLVVQRIARKIPVLKMGVRFPPRAYQRRAIPTISLVGVAFLFWLRIKREYHELYHAPPFSHTTDEGVIRISKRRKSVLTKIPSETRRKSDDGVKAVAYDEAFEEFLRNCRIKGLSIHTVNYYVKELKQVRMGLVASGIAVENVRQINKSHIERLIEYYQSLNRAHTTINSRLRAGRSFFEFCIANKYAEENPFDAVDRLKVRHEVGATFNKRQLKKLLDEPDVTTFVGMRDLTIMLTFAHTGIRLTELCALRVQDVTFDGKGAINLPYTKNRQARRIPLTARLRSVLKAYVTERGTLEHDMLFINVEDGLINPRTIQERLKNYGISTGVEREVKVSPHAFRRTFCRLKVEAGTNLFVLQRLTGHQDLEVLKRYVQIYGKDLEDAIEQGFEET